MDDTSYLPDMTLGALWLLSKMKTATKRRRLSDVPDIRDRTRIVKGIPWRWWWWWWVRVVDLAFGDIWFSPTIPTTLKRRRLSDVSDIHDRPRLLKGTPEDEFHKCFEECHHRPYETPCIDTSVDERISPEWHVTRLYSRNGENKSWIPLQICLTKLIIIIINTTRRDNLLRLDWRWIMYVPFLCNTIRARRLYVPH